MADFLAAVKTARKEAQQPRAQLQEVANLRLQAEQAAVECEKRGEITRPSSQDTDADTPEQALRTLKEQPNLDTLLRVLRRIQDGFSDSDFNIQVPGPRQAQIINSLVTLTLPDFWPTLKKSEKALLLGCLRNVAGINAVLARIRYTAERYNEQPKDLELLCSVLHELLSSDALASNIWAGLSNNSMVADRPNDLKLSMAWKELVGLITSGKIVSIYAQAEDQSKQYDVSISVSWLSNGTKYAEWLGRNSFNLAMRSAHEGPTNSRKSESAAHLLSKSFALGYPLPLVRAFWTALVSNSLTHEGVEVRSIIAALDLSAKRQMLESTLRWLSTLSEDDPAQLNAHERSRRLCRVCAALIAFLCDSASMSQILIEFLLDPRLSSSVSYHIRRACIATISKIRHDELHSMLEKLIVTFGDQLFISHAPVLQQESISQLLLLSAGYLHRTSHVAVLMVTRSSGSMRSVSNRLDSTNQRARWLGMVVGTALSSLVDSDGSKIDFGTPDMNTIESHWYQELVAINDAVGNLTELNDFVGERSLSKPKKEGTPAEQPVELPIIDGKPTFGPPRPPQPAQTEAIGDKITELFDDQSDDDDDDNGMLKRYAKPDSDPEDSDEDATLVNRNKAKPPVYIRDLLRMLKDDKDHDRFQMGVRHAAALIRRKSKFGAEVKDHAEELALTLCDLQDPFSTDDFDQLRLRALIAVLLSDIRTMAPWFSKQVFTGDYGLAQRCVMLSALGLGGREVAGFKDQEDLNPVLPKPTTLFPSKQLPSHLHELYSPPNSATTHLNAASEDMQHQLIKPLALFAADKTTSHLDAVKVRTFSSRMAVERTRRKPTANELGKVFGSFFFFPLLTRYQQDVSAYAGSSAFISAPVVLVTYLKTIALLLNASGPATTDLPDVTVAFWDLVLSLRVRAASDMSVLEAVLFCLLTLLDVNSTFPERLAVENAHQLSTSQQWVEIVFEKIGGGELNVEGSAAENKVRTLAAGVLVKISEIVQRRQKFLMGDLR